MPSNRISTKTQKDVFPVIQINLKRNCHFIRGPGRFIVHLVGSSLHTQLTVHNLASKCYEMKAPKAVWGDAVQTAFHICTTGAELIASLIDPCFKAKCLYKAVAHLQVKCIE